MPPLLMKIVFDKPANIPVPLTPYTAQYRMLLRERELIVRIALS
jgi:hypothetical protein